MNYRFSPDAGESLDVLAARRQTVLDSAFPARQVALGDEGAELTVRELGTGADAIVLLHGIGSGSASWLDVALELQRTVPGQRVIAWDAPGYADSTPLAPAEPRGGDYARRLVALVRALSLRSVVLVGHSLGAFTAVAGAQALGADVVRRVVLVSPAAGYGAAGMEAKSAAVMAQRIGNLEKVGVAGMADAAGRSDSRMVSPGASNDARAWVRWNMARLNDAGYRQAVAMLCGDALTAYAPLDVPVEVHCGDHDVVTPPAGCEATARDFDASFALIEGPGHASPIEQPETVAGLIASACRSAAGART